jgi:Ser/Thr protein kinase RdoA (MazF antagonist)
MNDGLDSILSRTDLTSSTIDSFIETIFQVYPILGKLTSYSPIPIGFEDANLILDTNSGRYVLKIFANDLTLNNIRGHVQVLKEATKLHIPVPQFVLNNQHQPLTHIDTTDCFITRFFGGLKMSESTPDLMDIQNISRYIAHLNTLSFPLFVSNDSWGNNNVMVEFKRDRNKVDSSVITTLRPFIQEYRHFYLKQAHYGVIHADIQRKHIIKNTAGEYCLIDFGCARYDALVYELSTFLAWFCLDEISWPKHQQILELVLGIYQEIHHLNQFELDSLPLLIRAAYAAYYFRTAVLIAEGDDSQEVIDWNKNAQTMLTLSQEL